MQRVNVHIREGETHEKHIISAFITINPFEVNAVSPGVAMETTHHFHTHPLLKSNFILVAPEISLGLKTSVRFYYCHLFQLTQSLYLLDIT